MTTETAPGQVGAATEGQVGPGQARRPGLPDRMARYGIWVAIVMRILGDRRFQAGVITRAIGAYALGAVIKSNQAHPVRRAAAWYNIKGEIHDAKVLHHARQAVKPGNR